MAHKSNISKFPSICLGRWGEGGWGSVVLFADQQLPIPVLLWTPKWKMHIIHIMHCSQNNYKIPKTSLSHIFNSLLMFSLPVVMQGALFGVSRERYLGDSTRQLNFNVD